MTESLSNRLLHCRASEDYAAMPKDLFNEVIAALTAEAVPVAVPDLTTSNVPSWVKWPVEDYVQMRNEERDAAAATCANQHGGDWVKCAASYLNAISNGAPVMGSHHHYCAVLSQALMLYTHPAPASFPSSEAEAVLVADDARHDLIERFINSLDPRQGAIYVSVPAMRYALQDLLRPFFTHPTPTASPADGDKWVNFFQSGKVEIYDTQLAALTTSAYSHPKPKTVAATYRPDSPRSGKETLESIMRWKQDTFGEQTTVTPQRLAERALEEAEEVRAAIRNGEGDERITEESADVFLVLCNPKVWEAAQRKMKINRARKWQSRGDGTSYHIKEERSL